MDGLEAPEISIVLPVRNGANFLGQALESALVQDYPSYEIIVGINPSTDSTLEVARRILGAEHPGIIVFEDDVNMPQNFNRTAAQARGKYIKFLCHDDILKPSSLSTLVSEFHKKENLALVTSYESFLHSPKPSRRESSFGENHYVGKVRSLFRFSKYQNWIGGPSGVMVQTELFRRFQFDKTLPCAFDLDCWINLSRFGLIAIVPEELYSSRIHSQQGTNICAEGGFAQDLVQIWERNAKSSYFQSRLFFRKVPKFKI